MSEVQRITFTIEQLGAVPDGITDCKFAFEHAGEYVRSEDYDAAQSELAALREELYQAKRDRDCEQKACIEAHQRLADAERRNAALITALTYLRDASDDSHVFETAQDAINENNCSSCGGSKQERVLGRDNSEFVIDCSICTQPTESGASECTQANES